MRLNQFGVRQGGPIVRNKAFFFAHYEAGAESERGLAHAHGPPSAGARRLVPLQRHRRRPAGGARGQRARSRARQRADLQHRSHRDAHAPGDSGVGADDRQHDAGERSAAAELLLPQSRRSGREAARDSSRLQHQPEPSPHRHLQPLLRVARAGPYQRRGSPVPGIAELSPGQDEAADAVRSPCGRRWAQRWSTSCAAGSRLARSSRSGSPSWMRRMRSTSTTPTAGPSTSTLNIGLTNWYTEEFVSSRSGYQYTLDETLNWQKGAHSVMFGGAAFLGRVWNDSQQLVPRIDLRFDQTNDPGGGLVHDGELRRRIGRRSSPTRAILYALLTGRVGAVTGQATLDPETNSLQLSRPAPPRREARRLLGVRSGLMARHADSDAQRRRALGRADAVLAVQRHDDDREPGGYLRRLGSRRRRSLQLLQLLRAGIERRQGARVRPVHDRHARLQHRLEQHRAQHRRSLGVRTSRAAGCVPFSAIPNRRPCAAATRWPTSVRAYWCSPVSMEQTLAARSA